MLSPRFRGLLIPVLIALMALAACGGSDDDPAVATTTTAATNTTAVAVGPGEQGYCDLRRSQQEAGSGDIQATLDAQLEVAPDELRPSIQILLDNLDILEAQPDISQEQRAVIAPAVVEILTYEINRCGLSLFG